MAASRRVAQYGLVSALLLLFVCIGTLVVRSTRYNLVPAPPGAELASALEQRGPGSRSPVVPTLRVERPGDSVALRRADPSAIGSEAEAVPLPRQFASTYSSEAIPQGFGGIP